MTSWALIFTIWYSLLSEPDGAWRYVQLFGWFDNKMQCEEYAATESSQTLEFSIPYRSLMPMEIRSMKASKVTYNCVSQDELTNYLKERRENVD